MADERPLPVCIVDDDAGIRKSTHFLLNACGYLPSSFASGRDFLDALPSLAPGCVLLDIRMPEVDGIQVLEAAPPALAKHAVIVMTGHGGISIAVRAMKLGAVDFIEKPFQDDVLVATLDAAFGGLGTTLDARREHEQAIASVKRLTARETDVLRGLLAGQSNKIISFGLGLSVRTVEMHRAHMMERLGVRSLSDALKIAMMAALDPLRPAGADGGG